MTSNNNGSTAPRGVTTGMGPFAVVPAWVIQRTTPKQLAVWLQLAVHADRGHEAFPSIPTMAEAVGCSNDTIRRSLRELKAAGLVTIEPRTRSNGGRTSNLYVLTMLDPGASYCDPPSQPCEGPPSNPASAPPRTGARGISLNQIQKEPLPDVPPGVDVPVTRKRDQVWDSVVAECRIDMASLTLSGKSNLGKTVRELKAVGATPEDIHERSRVFRKRHPRITLTHNTLRNRWAELAPLTPPRQQPRTGPKLDLS